MRGHHLLAPAALLCHIQTALCLLLIPAAAFGESPWIAEATAVTLGRVAIAILGAGGTAISLIAIETTLRRSRLPVAIPLILLLATPGLLISLLLCEATLVFTRLA